VGKSRNCRIPKEDIIKYVELEEEKLAVKKSLKNQSPSRSEKLNLG